MSRSKGITEEQFFLDCINKEYELAGTDKHFNTYEELKNFTHENPEWYDEYHISEEKYNEWKKYVCNHYKEIKGKSRTPKYQIERAFGWFGLNYGFIVDHETLSNIQKG